MVHVRFDEEAEELPQAAAPAAHQQAEPLSSGSFRTPHCCFNVRIDFNMADPAYVFKAALNPANGAVAASTSSNIIKLYSATGADLTHVGDLKGHNGTISDVAFSVPDLPHLVHSCSADGTVKGWDIRSGQQVENFHAGPEQELYCFGVHGHVVAAGTSGELLLWDRRTGSKAGVLDDTHMDEITQVKFHPGTGCMISASLDGLVAVHDTRRPLTDDDAFVAALNLTNSVEELGLYGPSGERLWVRTGTETLHLWEWGRAAAEQQVEGGEMAFADFSEARITASQAAAAAGGLAAQSFAGEDGVGYLVGCHYDLPTQQLMLIAGQEGAVGMWPITEVSDPVQGRMVGGALQPPNMVLAGAHTGVVRSVQCYGAGASGAFCITGGEDSQICLWSLDPNTPPVAGWGGAAGVQAAGQRQQKRHGGSGSGPGPDRGQQAPQQQGQGGGQKQGGRGGQGRGGGKGGGGGGKPKRVSPY